MGKAADIFDKKISFRTFPEGTVLKEGQALSLISYPKQHWTDPGINKLREALSRIRVKMSYESLYGDKFEETNLEKDT